MTAQTVCTITASKMQVRWEMVEMRKEKAYARKWLFQINKEASSRLYMQQTLELKSVLSIHDSLFVLSILLAHDQHDKRSPAVEGMHSSSFSCVGIVVLPVKSRLLVLPFTPTEFYSPAL